MAKKNAKKTSKRKNADSQGRSEAIGILIVAFALFIGVSLFSNAVGVVGDAVSSFTFSLLGIGGYAAPFLIIAWGIYLIAAPARRYRPLTVLLSLIGVLFILVIVQIFSESDIVNEDAAKYMREAYVYSGEYRSGGGFLGALLAYPSLYLIGKIGSYIFYLAGILIIILFITRLSLKSAGKVIGETIKEGVSVAAERVQTRKAMYIEDVSIPYEDLKKPKKKRSKKPSILDDGDVDILPASGPIKKSAAPSEIDLFSEDDETAPFTSFADNAEPNEPEVDVPVAYPKPKPAPPASEPSDPFETSEGADCKPPYVKPPISLLNLPKTSVKRSGESAAERARKLEEALASFNISAKVMNITVGPVITRYEVQPAQGVRVNRITALSDDLALALAAERVRIEAPIPGKAAIGIEIPNSQTSMVTLREIIESPEFAAQISPISFALGKDISGRIMTADLDGMPHLLIGGSTGSGKSVCINDIIISMVYKSSPDELGLILVDPKVVELSIFSTLPHLLVPVVNEPKKAAGALKWAVRTIEERYVEMNKYGVRNIAGYNELNKPGVEKMKRIVIVIDELADLMMVSAKDVEDAICRIGQIGRAAGIHLIVATQRPSTDVITGLIKANIPSRIAFMVSSLVDSRIILDAGGAEKLIGKGDMLFHKTGASKPTRIQGAFVTDSEVQRLADFFGKQTEGEQSYDENIMANMASSSVPGASTGDGEFEDDRLYEAAAVILTTKQASSSMLQRRMHVGYARAARLVDILEKMGIVGAPDGSKPRAILIGEAEYEEIFGRPLNG